MARNIMTRENIILKMMPFSDPIIKWCIDHPEFRDALKIIYPDRFITLQAIVISYSPYKPKDQVLGIFAYDYQKNQNKFKQDFIVNSESKNEKFTLYTRLSKRNYSKYVRDINEFYSSYAKGTHYADTHHPKLEDLPPELQERAKRVIKLANGLKTTGLRQLSEKEINEFEAEIDRIRSEK